MGSLHASYTFRCRRFRHLPMPDPHLQQPSSSKRGCPLRGRIHSGNQLYRARGLDPMVGVVRLLRYLRHCRKNPKPVLHEPGTCARRQSLRRARPFRGFLRGKPTVSHIYTRTPRRRLGRVEGVGSVFGPVQRRLQKEIQGVQ